MAADAEHGMADEDRYGNRAFGFISEANGGKERGEALITRVTDRAVRGYDSAELALEAQCVLVDHLADLYRELLECRHVTCRLGLSDVRLIGGLSS